LGVNKEYFLFTLSVNYLYGTLALDIVFCNKTLEKYAHDDRLAKRKLGDRRAKAFKARLDTIDTLDNLGWEVIKHFPGRFHPLKENRKMQWSADLDHPYRLIFRPLNAVASVDGHGRYVWEDVTAIEIIEIVDTHE